MVLAQDKTLVQEDPFVGKKASVLSIALNNLIKSFMVKCTV
jgi:hypothetical protein